MSLKMQAKKISKHDRSVCLRARTGDTPLYTDAATQCISKQGNSCWNYRCSSTPMRSLNYRLTEMNI